MKKILTFFLSLSLISYFLFLQSNSSLAKEKAKCEILPTSDKKELNVNVTNLEPNQKVAVILRLSELMDDPNCTTIVSNPFKNTKYTQCGFCGQADSNGNFSIQIPSKYFAKEGEYEIKIIKPIGTGKCATSTYTSAVCQETVFVKDGKLSGFKKVFYLPEVCEDGKSIKTGIGCIPVLPQYGIIPLFQWTLNLAISIAGGIAFLLMLYGGFTLVTSSGDPEKIEEGKKILTSAIAGLFLIIFSVFLLKTVGITILKIPGFN